MSKNKDNKKESFFLKMKDKKYKAKVEFIGYGVLILLVVVYLNISHMGSSSRNVTLDKQSSNNEVVTDKKSDNLLDSIVDNYQYDMFVNYVIVSDSGERIENGDRYTGEAVSSYLSINKKVMEEDKNYYKMDDNYYEKVVEGEFSKDNLKLVRDDDVYSVLSYKYIEMDSIKKLLSKASLDHVTDYSSGKREEVYHLRVMDVIKSYQGEDLIEVSLVREGENITMEIDYSKLLPFLESELSIEECKVKVSYTNIGKVEDKLLGNDESGE